MKLYINIAAFECSEKFYDIFKKFTDDGGVKVGVAISDGNDDWKKSVPKEFSDSSRKFDSNSNFIVWNYWTVLEYSSVDQKICFQFKHGDKIIYQFYSLISEFRHGDPGELTTVRAGAIGTEDGKGYLKFAIKFSN